MGDRSGPRDHPAVVKDGCSHGAIVQMGDTYDIGIIRKKGIAGFQRLEWKPLEYCAHQPQRRTEMRRRVSHQRERAAARIADRGRTVRALFDVRRERSTNEARSHFVRRRLEGAGDDFELCVCHANYSPYGHTSS